MASKQILAQIGVFALLGLNVGAYYVFWPHKDRDNKVEAQAPPAVDKGVTQLLPDKKDKPAPPRELPAKVLIGAVPLQIDNTPVPAPGKPGEDESIARLLQHIQKETKTPNDDVKPMPIDPFVGERTTPRDPGIATASAQTPKIAPIPWLVNMEMIGQQTQLTAKLKQPAVEFTILCDRIEMKAPGGTVQALGKVTFSGAGLKGSCQRLTLLLHETRLVFEDRVEIVQDAKLASNLRGDRIVWELPAAAAETQPVLPPLEFPPHVIYPSLPPIQGKSK